MYKLSPAFLRNCFHLIGSYAMRDLVSNLPSGQQRPAKNLEEDTVVAILNTIHEIVTDSSENARSLIQAQAIEKLVAINRTRYLSNAVTLIKDLKYGRFALPQFENMQTLCGWKCSVYLL